MPVTRLDIFELVVATVLALVSCPCSSSFSLLCHVLLVMDAVVVLVVQHRVTLHIEYFDSDR